MILRMILPNFIVSQFVPPNACRKCGRSDLTFTVLAPSFVWHRDWIELNYPLRCPCGGSGYIPIHLPMLFFGFLLSNLAMLDAARLRRSKAVMTISAQTESPLLNQIVGRFSRCMQQCNCPHKCVQTGELALWRDLAASPDDRERFGMEHDEWDQFLRRLGIRPP